MRCRGEDIFSEEEIMILEHYSDKPLEWPPRDFEQVSPHLDGSFKPRGLWVSVKGEDDWPAWCKGEEFRLDALAVCQRVILTPEANLKIVSGERELFAFDKEYGCDWHIAPTLSLHRIDWPRLAQDYDGLIIAPYVWSCRLGGWDFEGRCKDEHARISDWYYPWDCASGCIWNGTRAIAAFETIEQEEEKV